MSFSGEGTHTFSVSIYNYAKEDPGKYASEDITYTINVSLLDQSGKEVTDQSILSQYKLDGRKFSELGNTTDTLNRNEKSEKTYSITVPTEYMKTYKIKIIAEPTNNTYKSLGRIISFSEDVVSSKWRISYLSDEQSQKAYDLGCIHVRLTGSEYARLTLTWNTQNVQIDPWFLEDIKESVTVNTENPENSSLTFTAGGDTGTNQYNITFYRTTPVHKDDTKAENWDDIKSYISLTSEKLTKSKTTTTK